MVLLACKPGGIEFLAVEAFSKELQDTLAAAQQIYDTDTAHAALMPNGGMERRGGVRL